MANNMTTMTVARTTLRRVETLGKKGETYDDVINRILDEREAKNE